MNEFITVEMTKEEAGFLYRALEDRIEILQPDSFHPAEEGELEALKRIGKLI